MRRLYLRIYLAFLGSLVVFALLAGLTVALLRLVDDRPERPWPDTGSEIAERLLPPGRDPALLASELQFWSERTGFALALFSSGGTLIAEAGDAPPDLQEVMKRNPPHGRFWHAPGGLFGLTLTDGRRLIAIPAHRHFNPVRALRFPAIFLGLAIAIAIGFYPLIRYLTRRLEELESGVARLGEGDFSTRVPVKGRDEIARLAATFNAAAGRIQALMAAHKQLLAHASHELRSPLSRLRMAMERLKTRGNDEAAQAEATRNIGELDTLVEEILLSSRLQAGASALENEPVDVAGLLAEECAVYHTELTVACHALPTVEGDPRLLRRLFRNLLDNASSHGGPEPAEATLAAGETGVRVLVCDRGPGIPEAERDKIFEPFYQLPGRAHGGGAGLGLALVRQIATQHGGQVCCHPREGGGACFEVSLPYSRPADRMRNVSRVP